MKRLFVILFLSLFVISLVSALPHSDFPGFSSSGSRLLVDDTSLVVSDDIIFNLAYYSTDGDSWSSLSLSGVSHPSAGDWLLDSASASIPDNTKYLVVYSCSLTVSQVEVSSSALSDWDCHGRTSQENGFWQLVVLDVATPAPNQTNNVTSMSCDTTNCKLKDLSEDQQFILPNDAPIGEYVGVLKVYPEFREIGDAPVFTIQSDTHNRYAITSDGQMSIINTANMAVGSESFDVTISKNGFYNQTITVTVDILDASSCSFVDTSQSSNGDGTRVSPYNSAPLVAADNTCILFKRGVNHLLSSYSQGHTLGYDNVLFASYGVGDLPKVMKESVGSSQRIFYNGGSNNFILRDLHVTGSETTSIDSSQWPMAFYTGHGTGSTNTKIYHNEIWYTNGLTVGDDAVSADIRFNDIMYTSRDMIFLQERNNDLGTYDIIGNYLYGANYNYFVGPTEGQSPGDAIQTDEVTNLVIAHNFIDRSLTGLKFGLIFGGTVSETVLVEDNYFVSPLHDGVNIFAIRMIATIRNNYFADGSNALWIFSGDVQINNNVFNSTSANAIMFQGGTSDVFNNVFYDCGVRCLEESNGLWFTRNNIFYLFEGQQAYDRRTMDSDYNMFNQELTNMFGSGYDSLADLDSGEEHSIVGNPLFLDVGEQDFRLQNGSFAIDMGIDVGLPFNNDAPDMGAFESSFSIPDPTCSDGILNQGEDFVDCGGPCSACECVVDETESCSVDNGIGERVHICLNGSYSSWSDCIVTSCLDGYHKVNNVCVVDSCSDGILNQDEVQIDCGGSCDECVFVPNLLANGFENGTLLAPFTSARAGASLSVSTDVVYDGEYSLLFDGTSLSGDSYTGPDTGTAGRVITFAGQTTLNFSAYHYSPDVSLSGGVMVLCLDENNVYYTVNVYKKVDFTTSVGVWEQSNVEITCPATTTGASVRLYLNENGLLYFDNPLIEIVE